MVFTDAVEQIPDRIAKMALSKSFFNIIGLILSGPAAEFLASLMASHTSVIVIGSL